MLFGKKQGSSEKGGSIKEIRDDGATVILAGGSVWQISPSDRAVARGWLGDSKISLKKGGDPQYPYMLVNTEANETAQAKCIGKR